MAPPHVSADRLRVAGAAPDAAPPLLFLAPKLQWTGLTMSPEASAGEIFNLPVNFAQRKRARVSREYYLIIVQLIPIFVLDHVLLIAFLSIAQVIHLS